MHRRGYLAALAGLGLTSGCLGGGPSDDPTPVPVDGGATATSTTSPTPTPTPSPTPTATPSLGTIDEPALGEAVLDEVFEARGSTLTHEGSLADKLDEMAKYHSEQMAEARTVSHVIDGETPEDRHERFDLNCRFPDSGGGYIVPQEDLEVNGKVSTRGKKAEEAATELVQHWMGDSETKATIELENANHAGVGVTIVTGSAYVTVVYC